MKRIISLMVSISLTVTALLSVMSLNVSAAETIKIACVGDSITAGSNDYNYPMYLQRMLGDGYEIKNFGKGGASVRHAEEAVGDPNWGWGSVNDADGDGMAYFYYDDVAYTSSLEYDADYVFVMMGTNDVGSEDYSYYKPDYYNYLIKPYLDKGAEVIVMTSPTAYSYLMNDHEKINTTIRQMQIEIAEEYNLTLIDMNTATAGRRESFPDGLHGNSSGYMIIAQTIYKEFFGGEVYTVTANTGDAATITLENPNPLFGDYVFTSDSTGVGTVPVLPGTYDAKAKCGVFTGRVDDVSVTGDTTITFTYEAGSENYARSATVYVDSQNDHVKENAIDGDDTTRWQSASEGTAEAPAWLYLDFGATTVFDSVEIFWETARPSETGYVLQISDDAVSWTDITETERTRNEGADAIIFNSTAARYLRVYCTALENEKTTGPSIFEIEVYNVRNFSQLDNAKFVLDIALNQAAALNQNIYTSESWAILASAVNAGQSVKNSNSENADDYTNAATAITNAINGLESTSDGVLAAAVARANAVVRYRYSPESLLVLDGYLAEADTYKDATLEESVIQNMLTCADNIDLAIASLEINNLAAGKNVIIPTDNQTDHPDDYINDGSFTTRWASGGDCSTAPEHVTVDFGTATTVNVLEVYWEAARANEDMVTVQYSQDNVVWNDVTNAVFGGDINNSIKIGESECYYQSITFDAVKARYIRLYVAGHAVFGEKDYVQMSIWELEAYNGVESELSQNSAVTPDFSIIGAQVRDGANGTKDLRFMVGVSANLISNVNSIDDNFTDFGVVMARYDQLTANGLTADDLEVGASFDGVTIKTVPINYMCTVRLDKYGHYYYTVTILGIDDLTRFYSCRAYYKTTNGDIIYSSATATRNASEQKI